MLLSREKINNVSRDEFLTFLTYLCNKNKDRYVKLCESIEMYVPKTSPFSKTKNNFWGKGGYKNQLLDPKIMLAAELYDMHDNLDKDGIIAEFEKNVFKTFKVEENDADALKAKFQEIENDAENKGSYQTMSAACKLFDFDHVKKTSEELLKEEHEKELKAKDDEIKELKASIKAKDEKIESLTESNKKVQVLFKSLKKGIKKSDVKTELDSENILDNDEIKKILKELLAYNDSLLELKDLKGLEKKLVVEYILTAILEG